MSSDTSSITLILSVIGLMLSFSSLTLHFFKFYNQRASLKISFLNSPTDCIYFDKHKNSNYVTKKQAAVRVRVSNNSEQPITIYQGSLISKKYRDMTSGQYSNPESEYSFTCPDNTTRKIIPISKYHLKLPLTLQPYSFKEGYLFFGTCPDIIEPSIKLKLKLLTTRKNFTVRNIQLKEINYALSQEPTRN